MMGVRRSAFAIRVAGLTTLLDKPRFGGAFQGTTTTPNTCPSADSDRRGNLRVDRGCP
jgi:hypothetical protein